KGQEPIGIIGMDINFDTIIAIMDRIDVHPQQRVCLMGSDGICYYSRVSGMQHEEEGANCALLPTLGKMHGYSSSNHLIPYSCGGQEYHMAYHTLKNGMLLAISAPTAVINASRNNLVMQIALLSLISIILAIASSFFVGRHIVHPLRELNSAAQRIASGDMDITLIPHTQDEVGTLTKTLQQTVDHLRHYIHYINDLAYRDPLTGLKNKAAYHEAKLRLEELILRKKPVFALLVIDINGLKEINDIYGHDFGDMLIINASRIIGRVFKHSPVFRIGGDEFVVLLEDIDYQDRPRLLEELQKLIDIHNQSSKPEMRVFMARGLAEYDSEIDSSFGDVFQRADKAMYENKAIMKTGAVLDDDL
ncbi:MAG: diguanylate cyclase, partial [Desulfovibrionaceae bacterium]|nr:diguanylate cyclase [Desulfovibrionaceae bacterium]